jgi:lipopolysaccharide export system protein LptC
MNLLQSAQRLHQNIPGPWLVALIMVICFFAFSLRQKDDIQVNEGDPSSFPQYYMKSVETREYNPEGKLRYQLTTPQVTHFQLQHDAPSANDYTLLDQPEMRFYDADSDNEPWQVTANTGRSETNGQLIRLLGDVLIQQQTHSNGLVRITTTELNLHTNTQFAQTDKAVNMRSAKGQMSALGMEADLAKSWLTLKSQVKAVYEPR